MGFDFNKPAPLNTAARTKNDRHATHEVGKHVLTFPTVSHYSALLSCGDVVASEPFQCKPVKAETNL